MKVLFPLISALVLLGFATEVAQAQFGAGAPSMLGGQGRGMGGMGGSGGGFSPLMMMMMMMNSGNDSLKRIMMMQLMQSVMSRGRSPGMLGGGPLMGGGMGMNPLMGMSMMAN
ncbi:hypothetical protein ACOMHN_028783 [Nucella lapillus]